MELLHQSCPKWKLLPQSPRIFRALFFMKTFSITRIPNNTSLTDNACYGQLAFRRLWNRCWQREHTVERANHMRNKPPTWSIAVGWKWVEAFWTSLCVEKGGACTWASKFADMCYTKNDLKNKAVPVARWATTLMRKPKQSLTRRCQMNLTWRRNFSWVCRGKAKKRKWKLWFPASSCHEGDTTLCKTARLVSLCFRRAPQFNKTNPALLPQRNLSSYTGTSRTFLSASSSLKCSETLPSLQISSPCWPLCILPHLIDVCVKLQISLKSLAQQISWSVSMIALIPLRKMLERLVTWSKILQILELWQISAAFACSQAILFLHITSRQYLY